MNHDTSRISFDFKPLSTPNMNVSPIVNNVSTSNSFKFVNNQQNNSPYINNPQQINHFVTSPPSTSTIFSENIFLTKIPTQSISQPQNNPQHPSSAHVPDPNTAQSRCLKIPPNLFRRSSKSAPTPHKPLYPTPFQSNKQFTPQTYTRMLSESFNPYNITINANKHCLYVEPTEFSCANIRNYDQNLLPHQIWTEMMKNETPSFTTEVLSSDLIPYASLYQQRTLFQHNSQNILQNHDHQQGPDDIPLRQNPQVSTGSLPPPPLEKPTVAMSHILQYNIISCEKDYSSHNFLSYIITKYNKVVKQLKKHVLTDIIIDILIDYELSHKLDALYQYHTPRIITKLKNKEDYYYYMKFHHLSLSEQISQGNRSHPIIQSQGNVETDKTINEKNVDKNNHNADTFRALVRLDNIFDTNHQFFQAQSAQLHDTQEKFSTQSDDFESIGSTLPQNYDAGEHLLDACIATDESNKNKQKKLETTSQTFSLPPVFSNCLFFITGQTIIPLTILNLLISTCGGRIVMSIGLINMYRQSNPLMKVYIIGNTFSASRYHDMVGIEKRQQQILTQAFQQYQHRVQAWKNKQKLVWLRNGAATKSSHSVNLQNGIDTLVLPKFTKNQKVVKKVAKKTILSLLEKKSRGKSHAISSTSNNISDFPITTNDCAISCDGFKNENGNTIELLSSTSQRSTKKRNLELQHDNTTVCGDDEGSRKRQKTHMSILLDDDTHDHDIPIQEVSCDLLGAGHDTLDDFENNQPISVETKECQAKIITSSSTTNKPTNFKPRHSSEDISIESFQHLRTTWWLKERYIVDCVLFAYHLNESLYSIHQ